MRSLLPQDKPACFLWRLQEGSALISITGPAIDMSSWPSPERSRKAHATANTSPTAIAALPGSHDQHRPDHLLSKMKDFRFENVSCSSSSHALIGKQAQQAASHKTSEAVIPKFFCLSI